MSGQQRLAERAMIPPSERVPLRGRSGKLYGILDIRTLCLEVKHKDTPLETIDLRAILIEAGVLPDEPPEISPL